MTAIKRFDQGALGPNLVAYFNPNEPGKEPVVQNTDEVLSVPPGYDSLTGDVETWITERFSDYPRYNPADPPMVSDALKGVDCWGFTNTAMRQVHPVRNYEQNGFTLVIVYQVTHQTAYIEPYSVGLNEENRLGHWGGNASDRTHRIIYPGVTQIDSEIPMPRNVPTIIGITQQPAPGEDETQGTTTLYVKDETNPGQVYTFENSTLIEESTEFYVGNGIRGSGQSLGGPWGIFLVYDRQLSTGELEDVAELCQYWIDNGEAPDDTPDYPLSTQFGPVSFSDPEGSLQWEVNFDSGGGWQNVEDTSLDYSFSTSGDAIQSNNILVIESAQVGQDCQIRCRGISEVNQEGIITPPDGQTARLEVYTP